MEEVEFEYLLTSTIRERGSDDKNVNPFKEELRMKVVKVLIRNGGPECAVIKEERKGRITALMKAAKEGDVNAVKQIVNVVREFEEEQPRSVTIDMNVRCTDSGFTALHHACAHGNFDVVKQLLLSSRVNPNVTTDVDLTHGPHLTGDERTPLSVLDLVAIMHAGKEGTVTCAGRGMQGINVESKAWRSEVEKIASFLCNGYVKAPNPLGEANKGDGEEGGGKKKKKKKKKSKEKGNLEGEGEAGAKRQQMYCTVFLHN